MNNNLKHLIELQKIDSRLLDIANLRGDLPVKVEELTKVAVSFKSHIYSRLKSEIENYLINN